MDGKTAVCYIGVFERMSLLRRIEVWVCNRLSYVVKTQGPVCRLGIALDADGINSDAVQQDGIRFGLVLDNCVFQKNDNNL